MIMDLKEVLVNNYIPYAKGVIVGRAIPGIDGFKPVVRRILYVMYLNKLQNQRKKSQSIVGDTMKIHPNGDAAIYDALVRLTTGHGALNVPYIESKGNFGKFYSRQIAYAAPRYTEAKLSEVAELLFDGIEENAVEMKPNYDSTTMEPKLLPVKFPNILVNNTGGIAVAMSSDIPNFGLAEVCNATIGILDGTITTDVQLANTLVAPEFPTGGSIHLDPHVYMNIIKTGRGSLTATGTAEIYNNKIVITEVPYGVKIEDVLSCINDDQEVFKDVSKAVNLTGRNGMRLEVVLKRGANPQEIYDKIVRYTKFRTSINFNTSVIINDRCHNGSTEDTSIGIMELLNEWIAFRLETIRRVYEFRLGKKQKAEKALQVWEKIKDSLPEVAKTLINNTESDATNIFKAKYNLDDEQVASLLNMRARDLTSDRLNAKLRELEKTREEIKGLIEVVNDEEKRKEISIGELKEIVKKFGKKKNTSIKEPLVLMKKEKEEVSKEKVKIVITKNNNVKRVMNPELEPRIDENDPVVKRIICGNDQSLLVFTASGYCYKIKVNDIDCSRTIPNSYLYSLIQQVDQSEIVHITATDSSIRKFNVLHPNAKYDEVFIDRFSGNRRMYKGAFTPEAKRSDMQIVTENNFFLITNMQRMAYVQANSDMTSSRLVTKGIGGLKQGEEVMCGIAISKIINYNEIDINRYDKGYFVKKRDVLHTLNRDF
jgi:DNA gyrase subunit A